MARQRQPLRWLGVVAAVICLAAGCGDNLLAAAQAVDCSVEADGTTCDDGSQLTVQDRCSNGDCSGICRAVTFNGDCVEKCPDGYVRDSGSCSQLQPQCGTNCLDCASDDKSCARCRSTKYLEDGECRDECSIKGSNGESSFREETDPYGRYCNTAPPTEETLSQEVIIGIAAGGGALLLIVIGVVVYIQCDRRRTRLRLDLEEEEQQQQQQQHNASPFGGPGNRDSFMMTDLPPPPQFSDNMSAVTMASTATAATPSEKDKRKWQKTVRRLSKSQALDTATLEVSAATQHVIDNMPTATLDDAEARHVFARLAQMRQDRALYFVLLKDMQRRQKKKAELRQSTERYDHLIADLTVVLQLFQQSKSNHTFPVNCMRLLDWAQSTLDKYVSARAARMGATTSTSES